MRLVTGSRYEQSGGVRSVPVRLTIVALHTVPSLLIELHSIRVHDSFGYSPVDNKVKDDWLQSVGRIAYLLTYMQIRDFLDEW